SADELADALINAQKRYNGDFMIVFADVYVEAEAIGCRLEFPEDAPPHIEKTCSPDGLRATIPQRDGRLPMMLAAAKRVIAELGELIPVFASIKDPFSVAALACGAEEFFELLISQPALARRAIEVSHQNQLRYLEALLEMGANVILGAPMASGGILGEKHFKTFALESIVELLSHIRSAGRLAGLHICGDSDPILATISRIPAHFVSLESFSVERWKELLSDGQPHPALMGYFPMDLLNRGSVEQIEAEMSRELKALWGFPHILATACDVPQRCPESQVQTFVKAARRWRPNG
ncbi:MAG TPA: uroporphyrinogen decarboxylase family protein, partial [bacterium]